ncbi:MAG: caspase family protein [Microcoleaceae cyanobacterium]
MGLQRREFLQRASWALAALGISETGWWQLQSRYSTALAETTGGKLALLVGINEYSEAALSGCVTDVEMQRELLIHRFGFVPSDILTLTNQQATRKNIETAFISHLTNQAKSDDLVFFHFSGYGSRVSKTIDEEGDTESISSKSTFQNTLVPIDGVSPKDESTAINDILQETLWLLLRSLPTSKIVTVLDTSYVYPGTNLQGSLRIRSRPSPITEQINIQEKAIQEKLRNRADVESEQKIYNSELPGVILNASKESLVATETDWDGFSSGLFTYALTQNLWSATSATKLQISFARATSFVEEVAGAYQQPELEASTIITQNTAQVKGQETTEKTAKAIGSQNILTPLSPPASGAIASVEDNGKTANLWLAGLPIGILDVVESNSLFTIVPPSASDPKNFQQQLQIRNRSGLQAKASIKEAPLSKQSSESQENADSQTQKTDQAPLPFSPQLLLGQLIREKVRILPKPISLRIALDPNLARIERVDATSGFSALPQVAVVASTETSDYVFSRVRETTIAQSLSAPLPSIYQGRYALFSLGEVLIPNSVGEGEEAVKVAAQRLTSQLKTLLAAKVLRLTNNESSTQLKVRATLATITPEAKVVMRRETLGVTNSKQLKTNIESIPDFGAAEGLLTLPIGSQVQCRLYNDGDRPIYFMLFRLDSSGRVLTLDPTGSNTSSSNGQPSPTGQVISAGESMNMSSVISTPRDTESFGWKLIGPAGLVETQIICSYQPFKETIAVLDGQTGQVRDNQIVKEVLSPLKVAEAILRDLQSASKSAIQSTGLSTDNWALDINSWSTLSFIYRVV